MDVIAQRCQVRASVSQVRAEPLVNRVGMDQPYERTPPVPLIWNLRGEQGCQNVPPTSDRRADAEAVRDENSTVAGDLLPGGRHAGSLPTERERRQDA